ncbi:hypothetical protein LCGC14_1948310 [marine sediment metagenome]|uniref:Uncharacterized protein n=1 Tax=marine sediment metagenome TaxID=412755 RepID=A0A0F9FI41_9ZZZZ
MKKIWTDKLKIGDWVIMGILSERGKFQGRFKVARVRGYDFDNFEELDLDKGDIKIIGEGEITKSDGIVNVLNKKELKALNIFRIKLKTLKGLEDDTIKKTY